jgi:hypothetical protein
MSDTLRRGIREQPPIPSAPRRSTRHGSPEASREGETLTVALDVDVYVACPRRLNENGQIQVRDMIIVDREIGQLGFRLGMQVLTIIFW